MLLKGLAQFVKQSTKKPLTPSKVFGTSKTPKLNRAMERKPKYSPTSAKPEPVGRSGMTNVDSTHNFNNPRREVSESYARRMDVAPTKRSIRLDAPAIPKPLANQAHSAFSNPRADLSTAELNKRAREQSAKLKKSPADRDRLRKENEAAQKRELADERKASKRRGMK